MSAHPEELVLVDFETEVVVERETLEELEHDSAFLNALMSLGVDNWDGYELAQNKMDK